MLSGDAGVQARKDGRKEEEQQGEHCSSSTGQSIVEWSREEQRRVEYRWVIGWRLLLLDDPAGQETTGACART